MVTYFRFYNFGFYVLCSSGVRFLAASTECSAGSNDHFVVGVGAVPSLVQFDGRPLGGANFQY
jgi:hypothetical protein